MTHPTRRPPMTKPTARDEISPLHGFVLNMVKHLLDDGFHPADISIALITTGVSTAEAKMGKEQCIAHLRDLLADIAGMH